MTLYEKNIKALEKKHADLWKYIKDYEGKSEVSVAYKSATNGEKYPEVCLEGKNWKLNSSYEPSIAAGLFAEQYKNADAYSVFFFFGFADGRGLEKIAEKMEDTMTMIVYEPSVEIFLTALNEVDCSTLFQRKNVYIVVNSEELLQCYLESGINFNNIRMLCPGILPNYDVVYPNECKHMLETMIYFMNNTRIYRNTVYDFRKEFAEHAISNMYDYLWQTDTFQLQKKLEEAGIEDVPAIIVAAGPSLNKNVQELKRAKGKALILVVDAAIRGVINAGIVPDFGMTIDARVTDRFFEGIDISTFPFIFEAISREDIVRKHKGKHFFDEYPTSLLAKAVIEEKEYVLCPIETGGSISTSAFSLIKALGFKKIVFIGQDLAFTGGQSYNRGLAMDAEEDKAHQKSRQIVQVKGNNGEILETDYQMDMYRKWLEKEIRKLPPDITVINATEGGAVIEGAKVQTLKEVIDGCTKEIDFEKLIAEVPLAFNEEERARIIKKIKREPKKLEKVKENISKAAKVVEDLEKAAKMKDIESQKRLIKEFDNLNKKIQKEPVQDLLLYYNSEIEFTVGDDILSAELTIPDLCKRAKIWYQGYEDAVNQLIKDLNERFINRLKEKE